MAAAGCLPIDEGPVFRVGDDRVLIRLTNLGIRQVPEDVVEAIEADGDRVLGVQWHPEMLPGSDPAFAWLIDRAGR